MIKPEEVYMFPIGEQTYKFLEKVWSSFVNKMVALVFSDQETMFDHSIFEIIQSNEMRIVASSTHFKMKEVIGKKFSKELQDFMMKTKPISIYDERNESARIIQKAYISYSHMQRPQVEFIDLRKDKIHPNLKVLLTATMRYAVGIPIVVKENPIGILWGIRRNELSEEKKQEIVRQLHTLFDVIEYVVALELDRNQDDYFARKNIEKADTTSSIHHLLYTVQPTQKEPVTSIIAHSHQYHKMYRLDASYIVPTSHGYSVSLKHFVPEEMSSDKYIILMIPGFFCRRSIMDKLSREMALRHGYRVFSMDMRGRSKYTMPQDVLKYSWTVDDYIQDDFPAVINWIHQSYPDHKIVVFGHSMGGMIPRFYCGSYNKILNIPGKENIPDPNEIIAGIVTVASPNFINLAANIMGLDTLRSGIKFLTSKKMYDIIFNVLTFPVNSAIITIDLNKFFKAVLNIHSSLRPFSFQVSSQVVNLSDFVGYKQISPPDWYMLVEDVFCEESVKVLMQFIRSQLSHENSFWSYDNTINYTEDLKNLTLPLMSVVGTVDKIVPASTIEDVMTLPNIKNKKMVHYEQGHLGIVFHQPTVEEICREAAEWMKTL